VVSTTLQVTDFSAMLLCLIIPRQLDWVQRPFQARSWSRLRGDSRYLAVALRAHELSVLSKRERNDGFIESNLGGDTEECLDLWRSVRCGLVLLVEHSGKLMAVVHAMLSVRPPYHVSVDTGGIEAAEKLEVAMDVRERAIMIASEEADFVVDSEGISQRLNLMVLECC
jgi:hypothetical protein